MHAELVFADGRRSLAVRQPDSGRFLLYGRRPALGESVVLDGLRREVVAVTRLSPGNAGVSLLPDFDHPLCRPCARSEAPPTADECRARCHEPGPR